MATMNSNSSPPHTTDNASSSLPNPSNHNKSPSKPAKIVLKRVLEINDSLKLHLYGTQLILEAGLMLNIPQITISKAQIIYHRFYYKQNRNLTDYPPFHIAMTSTYLASKLDENTRRHRDVLTVFDRLHKKRNHTNKIHLQTIDPHGKRYTIWKENLFNFEIRMLASMGFNCSVDSSHKYLLQLLVDLQATENLAKQSWALLNDLHRLPHILDYTELQVSCSCIFLSARRLKIKLPDDPCWSDLFGVNRYTLHEISSILLELLELGETHKDAFGLPSQYKEDDKTLDVNPQTVQQQLKVIHKRNVEKHKRLKAAKLKNKKSATAPVKSVSDNNNNKVMVTKLVTVPKPTLGLKNGHGSNGIKQIKLNAMGTLTPPNVSSIHNASKSSKTIHFSSNKHQFECNTNDTNDTNTNNINSENDKKNKKDKKEKKDNDIHMKDKEKRARKSYKSSRDRDRDRHRDRYRRSKHSTRRRSGTSGRRRKSSRSRRDDRDDETSSDSEHYTSRRRSDKKRRDRKRDRDRNRRDRSSTYSLSPDKQSSKSKSKSRSRSRTPKEDKRRRSRSKSKSKQTDTNKKESSESAQNVE